MSDLDRRIAQFQNMTQADPENEMAHFSLGNALIQASRHAEAAESFLRATELAPTLSKGYQLAAECLVKAGDKDKAAQVATRGYTISAERGDRMPMTALGEVLKGLGRPVPEVAGKPAARAAGEDVSLLGSAKPAKADPASFPPGSFICRQSGRPGTKMSKPPFRGRLGAWIQENIAQETFDTWIGQGTKVINELRLDLSREQDADVYDQHMREFLGIDEELYARITSQQTAPPAA